MTMHAYQSPNQFGAEGVDHFNISADSQSQLGRVLCPGYHKTLNYPHIGKFASVHNLWHWLKYKPTDDRFRKLSYRQMRVLIEQEQPATSFVPNFKVIIGHATYFKLLSDPELIRQIKNSGGHKVPLSYYYPRKCKTRVINGYASVMVPIASHIIDCVVSGRTPDFRHLADHPSRADLYGLEGFIRSRYSRDQQQQFGL